MGLLGKVFTVCILIASICLMIMAATVYSTQKNWRDQFKTANTNLQAAQAAATAMESKYQDQLTKLNAEHEASLQNVRKLQSELEVINRDNATKQQEVDQLRAQERQNAGMVAATETNNIRLQEEVTKLRGDISGEQQARDEAFAKTLEATTQLHVTAGELQAIRERSEQLIKQLAHATSMIRESGGNPEGDVVVKADGKVSKTSRANGGQLIEITIGFDDGVRPGQTVEVFRGERYLGRAEILKADPDQAVGRVIREFQQGQIQEGDNVTTKLRVG
jgi:septal ring factor EnvC (AmiA/AmiB activator)